MQPSKACFAGGNPASYFAALTRAYFGVSGSYIWHFFPPDQLVAEEADGWMAEQFRNVRLKTNQSAIVVETDPETKAYSGEFRGSRIVIPWRWNSRFVRCWRFR